MADTVVLELLVENDWVVETLKALGSGHMLHLSFGYDQVEPATLSALESGSLGVGAQGEILTIGPVLRRVAIFELQKVNLMKEYLRLDFRLLTVTPFIRNGIKAEGTHFRCRCRPVTPG